MTIYEQIGQRIRRARRVKDLTQADLGKLLIKPRSHAAISDIERARTKLNLDELAEIAKVLGTSVHHIIGALDAEQEPPR